MIRVGKKEDKKIIFDLYGRSTSFDFENREDYFAKSFCSENVLVNEINGHVTASLQVNHYPMILHNKRILVSYMFADFYDHSKGVKNLNNLVNQAVANEQYKTLITLVPRTNPGEFAMYGFTDVYGKREYTIAHSDLANASYQGVGKEFTIDEISELYNNFVSNFNGYLLRDRQYWLDLLDLLRFKRYNLAVYHNEQGLAEGYMIYYIEPNKVVAKEIVYSNGAALTRLLCYGLRLKKCIKVYTSANEDFTRAFPNVKYKRVTTMVAKVNDFDLFNKLYNCNVADNQAAFYLTGRPLFLNEEIY